MKAMMLEQTSLLKDNARPLRLTEVEEREPGDREILISVATCGICHTELDEIEGRTPPPHYPVIPGHQVVGKVIALGKNADRFHPGDRVGVAWIFRACGSCKFCQGGLENLCRSFRATGRDAHGGYAEKMIVHEDFAYRLPDELDDIHVAPLLCAGAIGYRSVRLADISNIQNLGLTGFGASAHLVLKMVRHRYPRVKVSVFARSQQERAFAMELGASWAGDTSDQPPQQLDAIIDTTPVWKPDVHALRHLEPGGRLVINAIRKEEVDKESLLAIEYSTHLWMEKEIKSVANVTRQDVAEFLQIAADMKMKPEVEEFPLAEANAALVELKAGRIRGAKVLRI